MKQIPGYENYKITEYGVIYSDYTNSVKRTSLHRQGYFLIGLYKNKKETKLLVHRLVALTYLDNLNEYKYVNHKDGNKKNNHISNLEWVTSSENQKHAYKNGLKIASRKTINNKIVLNIESGIYYNSVKEASLVYGLNKSHLAQMLRGQISNKTNLVYATQGA
jgi:hypothetical protein